MVKTAIQGMGMAQEALSHLRDLRGPEKRTLSVPVGLGAVPANGQVDPQLAVPLGWKWTLKRWAWTVDAAAAASCQMFVAQVDRTNLLEVSAGAAPTGGYSAFADAIGNNAELRAGERLLFQFFGHTVGGVATLRLQVEAEQVGPSPEERDDFRRQEYEDAPPEEHMEDAEVGGPANDHELYPDDRRG